MEKLAVTLVSVLGLGFWTANSLPVLAAGYNPMPAAKPFGKGLNSTIAVANPAAAPSALQQLLSPLGLFITQLPALGWPWSAPPAAVCGGDGPAQG